MKDKKEFGDFVASMTHCVVNTDPDGRFRIEGFSQYKEAWEKLKSMVNENGMSLMKKIEKEEIKNGK